MENLTPLAKAMLVPSLTEAEIKVALGEDEVPTLWKVFRKKRKNGVRSNIHAETPITFSFTF